MILMPQIFDVIANENARYKRNELESCIIKGGSHYTYLKWSVSRIQDILYDLISIPKSFLIRCPDNTEH